MTQNETLTLVISSCAVLIAIATLLWKIRTGKQSIKKSKSTQLVALSNWALGAIQVIRKLQGLQPLPVNRGEKAKSLTVDGNLPEIPVQELEEELEIYIQQSLALQTASKTLGDDIASAVSTAALSVKYSKYRPMELLPSTRQEADSDLNTLIFMIADRLEEDRNYIA